MKTYWIAAAAMALMASPALGAGTVVKVSLWDEGPTSLDTMGQGPGAGTGMPAAGASNETVGITTNKAMVPAGEVTFEVVDDSKDIVHEMIVAPADRRSRCRLTERPSRFRRRPRRMSARSQA